MSETNSRNNEPCNYYGLNVCDSKGDCDKEHFDCITNHPNGDYCTTGLCPGDDKKKDSYDHKKKHDDNNNGNHNNNHKCIFPECY